jgi:thiosulfate dehydrogenase (quinone) large subunit
MPSNTANWRSRAIGLTRIAFGIIWAIDAWFKWQLAFLFNFTSYLTDAQAGQPGWIQAWIGFWVQIVGVAPVFFAVIVALVETALAISLLFGVMSNLAYFSGALLTLIIWAVPEGIGGPYTTGATDVGTGIIYTLVFVLLYLTTAGVHLGYDRRVGKRLGRNAWLASGQN